MHDYIKYILAWSDDGLLKKEKKAILNQNYMLEKRNKHWKWFCFYIAHIYFDFIWNIISNKFLWLGV